MYLLKSILEIRKEAIEIQKGLERLRNSEVLGASVGNVWDELKVVTKLP